MAIIYDGQVTHGTYGNRRLGYSVNGVARAAYRDSEDAGVKGLL